MRVAASVSFGESGEPRELMRFENAVRDPQTAHVGVLVGRDVEQTEISPAEIVRRFRILVICRLCPQARVCVEWMLLAFEFFLVRKLAARREQALLRLQGCSIGTDRL